MFPYHSTPTPAPSAASYENESYEKRRERYPHLRNVPPSTTTTPTRLMPGPLVHGQMEYSSEVLRRSDSTRTLQLIPMDDATKILENIKYNDKENQRINIKASIETTLTFEDDELICHRSNYISFTLYTTELTRCSIWAIRYWLAECKKRQCFLTPAISALLSHARCERHDWRCSLVTARPTRRFN